MVGNFTWTHIILKVLFCFNDNVSLSEQNLSYELKIRAGVHKRFMLIRDTATGLIQSAYNHRIFHASFNSIHFSNAISQEGQCPGPCHPVILAETDI